MHTTQFAIAAACASLTIGGLSCSDAKTGPSVGSGGSSTADSSGSDTATGSGGTGDGSGTATADTGPTGPGYVPLDPGIKGNWMHHEIGNCIDIEEWWVMQPPEGVVRTLVDRNSCKPHNVNKVAGNLKLLVGNQLELTWQKDGTYTQRRRTAAIVNQIAGIGDPMAQPTYKPGTRALTVLAFMRTVAGGPFTRIDYALQATDAPKAKTVTTTNVQIAVVPPPDTAKVGDACQMSVTLSAQYEPEDPKGNVYGSEKLEFPCHYAAEKNTGWLQVLADGYDAPSAWDKMFDAKNLWKKYAPQIGQLLYDGFRPNLLQPPDQRSVLLSTASYGWYYEYINEPPSKVE